MVDEIHFKPMVDVHINYGTFGFDSESSEHVAKTCFVFMVKSVFGSYKEIISLVPKFINSSRTLKEMTDDCLNLIKELGGTVVSLVTDNNRININMFQNFGIKDDKVCIDFFLNSPLKLFFMFDSVHILKNLRNNWINKKDTEKTIFFTK